MMTLVVLIPCIVGSPPSSSIAPLPSGSTATEIGPASPTLC